MLYTFRDILSPNERDDLFFNLWFILTWFDFDLICPINNMIKFIMECGIDISIVQFYLLSNNIT